MPSFLRSSSSLLFAVLFLATATRAAEEHDAASPAPEMELELATERGRLGFTQIRHQNPNILQDTALRYGSLGRKLLGTTVVTEDEKKADAPGPEMELDLATERGRIGGRTGINFGTGRLYTQNRFDDRRRLLAVEDNEEMMAAPGPEEEKMVLELATERGRIGGRTGINFGTGRLYTQNRFDDRRRLLAVEDEEEMAAPGPELEMATERGRIGGRTGFNFGTGRLYTQNRFDN